LQICKFFRITVMWYWSGSNFIVRFQFSQPTKLSSTFFWILTTFWPIKYLSSYRLIVETSLPRLWWKP